MSATIVQALDDTDATAENPSKTYTLTGMSGVSTTPGDALIALIACNTKTRTISSISDSATNTWAEIDGGGSSTSGFADMWWVPSAASISSLVLHMSGTSKTGLILYEVSGLAGTINNGGAAHHSTQNTTASTTAAESITATGTGDLLLIAAIGATAMATSVASPFSIDASAGGIGINVAAASAMQTGAGTYTATFTQTSQTSATVMAAFDVAGGGGGVTVRELMLLGVGA